MNTRRILSIIMLLFFFGLSSSLVAQVSGGRKKEHRNQRGGGIGSIFHKKKSGGHADAFAKNKRGQGFFARIFNKKKDGGAWVYKPTNPGKKQNKEQPHLFSRNRTKAKQYRDGLIARQNKQRAAERKHFSPKKRR